MRLPLLALAVLFAAASARAETPLVLSHSGYVLGADDRPVNAPTVTFGLSVWTDAMANGESARVWPVTGETTCTAAVLNGYYGLVLDGTQATGCGAGITAELFGGTAPRFLQVSVDGTPLLPRVRVTHAPVAALANEALNAARLGGKSPAEYAAAVHNHSASTVTDFASAAEAALNASGLPWERVTNRPDAFAPSAHTHPFADLSDVSAATAWPGTADWARVTSKPSNFPPSSHTHALAELSDVGAATAWPGTSEWARVSNKPASFPPSSHTHAAAEVTGLPAALANANIPGSLFVATNVGIGTTSAAAALDVKGNARVSGSLEQNGRYTLVANGSGTGNAEWKAEFSMPSGGSFAEIVALFNHAGGGRHWAYRRFEALFNGYVELQVLRDFESGGNSYGATTTASNGAWVFARPSTDRFTLTKTAGADPYGGPVNIWITSNAPVTLVSKTN